jgi:class 3 adenylate cyclase/tetratricopeptide (TPR) repeat protein
MHRLVPSFIQEQYAAGREAGSFEACSLFVDISGFTPITDAIMGYGQHGAEVLAGIILDAFDPLVRSVFEYGGFVTNFAGDAFTAVFPAAGESTEPIRSALAAAWQMQQLIASSAEYPTQYGTFTLSVKVGLSFGRVSWGIVSSADGKRAAYYFQGQAIDGCADTQRLANAGEVVVDAAVIEAVEPMAASEPVEDFYRITSVSAGLARPRPIEPDQIEPDIVNRFFPPQASQQELSGEFRQVVSMFISLPTVRTVDQLQVFMQIIFELQGRYGGLLNRLDFGDKGANLLLFWGAPIAHENDVIRALNFILDLQSQTVIPVSAGITYGIAHGGYSGGELAGEYTCHGRGTTLAARLMQAAPRGEVWVDEHIAERARRHFEVDFEDSLIFKGFAEAQKVFLLLERKEVSETFYQGQLIGRQAEQERLANFVLPLKQGQFAGALVVRGEPGIGKSRLVDAFLSKLADATGMGFSVFVCQTDEILREWLNPFRYWLRRYLEQSEQQSDARNKRSFNRKLDQIIATAQDEALVTELDRTRSFLAALVNLHWPDSLYEQLDAQGRYENIFSALVSLILVESLQKPVILLLEDAHWLDGDSRALLQELVQELTGSSAYPVAILATTRPEGEQEVLGKDIAYQEILLDQISPGDQALLAAEQLGAPIGSGLLNLLVERAEGNPFFTEQILRYLKERELLQMEAGRWRLNTTDETALPADVRAVLVARLDRLEQYVRDVVQTASVLGREFEIKLLALVLGDDPELEAKVVQAEKMAIWVALNELRYMFKHTLLRDAAYRMQTHSRRQALHRLAAEAIEKLYADDLGSHCGELAYHAEQAHQIDKARQYLELAGEIAKDAYQNSLALDYYTRALSLTPADDLESRFRILDASQDLAGRVGAHEEQALTLDEMWVAAEELDDVAKQIRVLISRAWMFWWRADYDVALIVSRQAANTARAAGQQKLATSADIVSVWTMIQHGEYGTARLLAEGALVSARQSGNRSQERNALHALSFVYRVEGDYYTSLQSAEQALAVDRLEGSLEGEGTTLGNIGVAHMTLGDYHTAREYFQKGLDISRETGSRIRAGSGLVNLAWNALAMREWETAIARAGESLSILRGVKQIENVAEGLIWLGHAWTGLGQIDKAFAAYKESLELRRQLRQENLAMSVVAGMARAALAQNDVDAALKHAAEILAFLDAGGSLDGTWEPLRLYLTCYQALSAAGDPRAEEMLQTAYEKLQKWAGKIPDEESRRMYLENVPWHREITAAYRDRGLSG